MPRTKRFSRCQLEYDSDVHSLACAVDLGDEPSLTIQSAKDEADINVIVKRFGVTGHVNVPARMPEFADYEDVIDFHSAMNAVQEARESFMSLPSNIRATFQNDPQLFLQAVQDPANLDMLRDLGLAIPVKESSMSPASDVPANRSSDARNSGKAAAAGAAASRKSGGDVGADAGGASSGD